MASDNTFQAVAYPHDPAYLLARQDQINRYMRMSTRELDLRLRYELSQPAPRDDHGMNRRIAGEIMTSPLVPDVAKNILGTASGSGLTDGSALIRQDLEPVLSNAWSFSR